ncbi:hypothetical protein NNRS527_03119 (plasmid) [Nitrosospira sp. NRS527]|nr:hypothetical protein NNRS527_03119 [Nitrosospira sp. NRS527]
MTWLANYLGYPSLGNMSGVPLWVFIAVLVLTSLFIVSYLIQGLRVWLQLRSSIRSIQFLEKEKKPVNPSEFREIFRWEPLKHLWDEYEDTLHELKKATNGELSLTEVRATVPAETFFTRDVLVDGRLFDDFTRHLPGVLTGLGIIGTFAGLLEGLAKFDPSSTTTAVSGLGPLMAGVEHAFLVSAIAISCAMGVTFISKLVLAYFYRLVEKLNHIIDAMYSTGAGEEYLSRLVHASEKNEAHTAQLKDALVEDLTKLMTNLVDRQIQAHGDASELLGNRISETISGSLAAPMERMTHAMEQTSRGNNDAVTGMLETMLSGFMAKLEDTFGGQMRGLNEQMQRSMDSMSSVQSALQQLLADIAKANEQATNQMSGKLEDAMKQAAANQALLTDQMREFVTEFRKLVGEEQDKSRGAMDQAVTAVFEKITQAVEQLEIARVAAASQEQTRGEQLANETKQLVGGLSGQVDTLLNRVVEQVQQTQRNIDQLSSVSLRAIEGMNQGALTMGTAAQRFETAGGAVTTIYERSSTLAEHLTTTAASLQTAAKAVQQGFEQYDTTRKNVDSQVAALTSLIESARKEAGLSKELMEDLERIVEQLRRAEMQSKQYLEQVNEALTTAFSDFGTALTNQLKSTIAQTDRHLAGGVGHLNGVVQELANAVSRMKPN